MPFDPGLKMLSQRSLSNAPCDDIEDGAFGMYLNEIMRLRFL